MQEIACITYIIAMSRSTLNMDFPLYAEEATSNSSV